MKKLKVIGVKSVFTVSVVLGAVLGFLIGVGFMLSSFLDHQYLLGLLLLVIAPLLYGVLFSAGNAFMAWTFNRIAERTGGIELTFEE